MKTFNLTKCINSLQLSGWHYIGVDTETCDPNLMTAGPGDIRKDGFITGVSLSGYSFEENFLGKAYIPLRSEGMKMSHYDEAKNFISTILGQSHTTKIGANLPYDLGWFAAEGIPVNGPKRCVQIIEALCYELFNSYTLDAIARRRLGKTKNEDGLKKFAQEQGYTGKNVKANMWKFPWYVLEEYAIDDADLVVQIYFEQMKEVKQKGLETVVQLESDLMDVLFAMRQRGIPISEENAERSLKRINELITINERIVYDYMGPIDIWSGKSIAEALDEIGVPYPRTEKGNPSIVADWLEHQEDRGLKAIRTLRQLDRGGSVFIKDKILGMAVKGRIHPNYSQTRRDDYGTRSGRLSSDNPNIQQVPARDPVMAPLIRACFIPDRGKQFGVFDYSQQEPRLTVHYAALSKAPGWEQAVEYYTTGPGDYHTMAMEFMSAAAGHSIARGNAKTINLGLAYGMGKAKLINSLGLDDETGEKLIDVYHEAMPFVKHLTRDTSRVATVRGYVKTILGRRAHFAGGSVHMALNRIIQGSAADQMKKALIELYHAGYLPYSTVHDEADVPLKDVVKESKEIVQIMSDVIPLKVPVKVGVKVGPSWGEVNELT